MEMYAVAAIAVLVLGFGVFAGWFRERWLTPHIIFVTIGWLLAPKICNVIHLSVDSDLVAHTAELTLLLVLFIDAAQIDSKRLWRERALPIRLLGIGLPLCIVLGGLVAKWMFPSLDWWEAGLLGAMLAPTDAALGETVVNDQRLPTRIRQTLSVESGLNDGLAFPLVLIAMQFVKSGGGETTALSWGLFIAQQIGVGVVVGVVLGYLGARLLTWTLKLGTLTDAFEPLCTVALAILIYSSAEALGGNGFIAAYAGGFVTGHFAHSICGKVLEYGRSVASTLSLLVLTIFGATMVWSALDFPEPTIIAYAVLSLVLIRPVSVAISLWGTGLHGYTVSFLGWFGPRGLASILFALILVPQSELLSRDLLLVTVTYTVLFSIFGHGLTSAPAAHWMHKRAIDIRKTDPNSPEWQ
jgi:NhaP-type Na+/H+ or K+/H+ antiporter